MGVRDRSQALLYSPSRATNHPCLNPLTTIDQYIIRRPMSWEIPQPLFPLPDLGGITAPQTKVRKVNTSK